MFSGQQSLEFRLFLTSLFLVALLPLHGCSLLNFQDSIDSFESATIILEGQVEGDSSVPVVVGALAIEDNRLILINYTVIPQPGLFELLLTNGEYLLFAYADINRNLEYDVDEPVDMYQTGSIASTLDVKDIAMRLGNTDRKEIEALISRNKIQFNLLPFLDNIGRVVGADDPRLSRTTGEMGLWQPMEFLSQGNAGVFFLHPYDNQKIPVVFIHGAGGSPDHFSKMVESMDADRFQPWLVSYPSSFRLERLGSAIYNALVMLDVRYRPKSMVLVAHSMGGLVARQVVHSAVVGGTPEMFKSIITISTPWDGNAMAAVGVKNSPVVVPNWIDMSPGSEFLSRWQEYPLQIPHRLIFTYKNEGGASKEASDGIIVLSSQLAPHIMHNTERLVGYNATHTGILNNQDFIAMFVSLLE